MSKYGMGVQDWARRLNELYDEKTRLEAAVDENKKLIQEATQMMADAMIDDDCAESTVGGYKYALAEKTYYTKRSDADIAAAGADYFDILRNEGLGGIIKETVNARTLQSTIRAYVEERGELSDDLKLVINEYTDDKAITRTKQRGKASKRSVPQEASNGGFIDMTDAPAW